MLHGQTSLFHSLRASTLQAMSAVGSDSDIVESDSDIVGSDGDNVDQSQQQQQAEFDLFRSLRAQVLQGMVNRDDHSDEQDDVPPPSPHEEQQQGQDDANTLPDELYHLIADEPQDHGSEQQEPMPSEAADLFLQELMPSLLDSTPDPASSNSTDLTATSSRQTATCGAADDGEVSGHSGSCCCNSRCCCCH